MRVEEVVFEAHGVSDLGRQVLGALLLHGLTPPFDREGVRLYAMNKGV